MRHPQRPSTQYDLKTGGGARVMGLSYQHDNAGRLSASTDLVNSNLNRSYDFDHAGRLVTGDTANGTLYGPYKQTYNYDVWGNLTYRSWRTFTTNQFGTFPVTNSATYSYSNNRNTEAGWAYDADGRLLASVEGSSTFTYGYDAGGRMTSASEPGKSITQSFDGDGLRAKWVENGDVTYSVRSMALGGQPITELNASGGKKRGYVYAGGQVIAKQESGQVLWDQRDVSGVSMRVTNSVGGVTSRIEMDPLGTIVDDTQTYNYGGGGNGYGFNPIGSYGDPTMPSMGCMMDGVPSPCSMVMNALRVGAAVQCPTGGCGPTAATNPNTGTTQLYLFNANAASMGIGTIGVGAGFFQAGVNFVGNGFVTSSWQMFNISPSGRAIPGIGFVSISQLDAVSDGYWSWAIQSFQSGQAQRSSPQNSDKAIASAVDRARTILSTKNPCSDYFGANAIKALDAFEKILTRGYPNGPGDTKLGIQQSGPQTTHTTYPNTTTEYRTFQNAVINNAGPFFNLLSKTRFGGYNPGSNQSQALQILHELAHLVYSGGAPLIPDDSGPTKKVDSDTNTREILKHCRDQIDKIKN